MSITLPITDMTGKTVGQSGQIPLHTEATKWNVAGHQGENATIRILNENGCGLKVWTDTNQINEWLGAGAWIDYSIEQGTLYLNWLVQYTIPNPPANQLMITFYSPGERVPPMATLGNSPIGGGTTTAVTGSTLSNEANSTPALIIDIGQVANTSLITIFSDGSFAWNIVVAGVVHTLMKGSVAKLLQLGMIADVTEVLGILTVDGVLNVGGGINLNGGDFNTTHNIASVNNVAATTMSTSGLANFNTLQSGGYFQNAGDADMNGHKVLNVLQVKFGNGNLVSGMNGGIFTPGALTGTINHGLAGTPNFVIVCPVISSGNSACANSYGATTFTFGVSAFGTGQQYAWFAFKF